jgi:hypothetical protein
MILLFLSGTVALSFPSQVVLEILLEVTRIIHVEDGRQHFYDVYRQPTQNCRFDVKTTYQPFNVFSSLNLCQLFPVLLINFWIAARDTPLIHDTFFYFTVKVTKVI